MTSKAQQAATKRYVNKSYVKMTIYMPKAYEDAFQAALAASGESRNRYIVNAILERIQKENTE